MPTRRRRGRRAGSSAGPRAAKPSSLPEGPKSKKAPQWRLGGAPGRLTSAADSYLTARGRHEEPWVALGTFGEGPPDQPLVAPFVRRFACRIGRPTVPIETHLRLMYLKHPHGLGYKTLVKEVEVSDSIHSPGASSAGWP